MHRLRIFLCAGLVAVAIAGCDNQAQLPAENSYGPNPSLPAPHKSLFPTYNVPSVKGWKDGEHPTAAGGLVVKAFATGLEHPRWLYVLPNGDVLVAEGNQGAKSADKMGYGGWLESLVRRIQGHFVKSANRITLLRDTNGGGVANMTSVLVSNLNVPFGMTVIGDTLYVADTDALMAFPYKAGEVKITDPGRRVTALPAGPINHHWTKNVIANKDGTKLYVTIGSNSNVGENGLAAEADRAMIWEIDPATGEHRVFASGLRNPNGMDWAPDGTLWTVVNERDELGSDLVPDYLTSVKDGGFYGWPYSYYGGHIDDRVQPQNPDLVTKAIRPDYALGTHTASLGLAWSENAKLGDLYASGVFVGQHGSWNRKPLNGYRVIFVPFKNAKPSGQPVDVLTGFLNDEGKARGRPVGLAIDKTGALLVADDAGNTVWRVSPAASP